MSDLGPIKYGDEQGEVFLGRDFNHTRNYSEDIATKIDVYIRDIVDSAYNKSIEILQEHMGILNHASEVLIKKEKITGNEFRKLMKGQEIDEVNRDETSIFEMSEQLREEENKISLDRVFFSPNISLII